MIKTSAVETRKNLEVANDLARTGIDFVCIPVHGEYSKARLLNLLQMQLMKIEKELEEAK